VEEAFRAIASMIALGVEALSVITVLVGAIEAIVHLVGGLFLRTGDNWTRRAIWLRFAGWIILALEFALGADIIRSAIAPSWDDIGKLAAIAAIRTGLNYFLERDMESALVRKGAGSGET
jgi:uncharacterized membrane protein